jgi:MoaA/NifB/PqqE/SkfB family radical SAM enzyme
MKQIIKITQKEKYLYMYWQLTDLCNFRCNYCNPSLHLGKVARGIRPGFPTDQEILSFLDNLENIHLKKFDKKLHCNLSGGEPTLHPLFPTILERLMKYGIVSITTNCSRDVSWWKKLPILPYEVQISLHPEFTKIDKVNEVVKFLKEKKVNLFFNLMCDPGHWDQTLELYEKLDSSVKNQVAPKVLNRMDTPRDNRSPWDYTELQQEWMKTLQDFYMSNRDLKKSPFNLRSDIHYDDGSREIFLNVAQLTIKKLNKHYNWRCSAGSRAINIDFDGKVYAGICKEKLLGRINDFQFLDEFVTCSKIYCICPGDMKLEKYNPKFFQEDKTTNQ